MRSPAHDSSGKSLTIGVFDSGIGGESVAFAIQSTLPTATVLIRSDKTHMPYGDKTPDQVLGFVLPILQDLANQGCQAIVIACNTVTTMLIDQLRQQISVPLIGIEPMVKPAAGRSKTGVIAVCATPATLSSPRYAKLKQTYAAGVTVLEPDCSKWAYMIEHNQIDRQFIVQQITATLRQNADVIVLGCTHYHWIEDIIRQIAGPNVQILQPEQPVIRRLLTLLNLPTRSNP